MISGNRSGFASVILTSASGTLEASLPSKGALLRQQLFKRGLLGGRWQQHQGDVAEPEIGFHRGVESPRSSTTPWTASHRLSPSSRAWRSMPRMRGTWNGKIPLYIREWFSQCHKERSKHPSDVSTCTNAHCHIDLQAVTSCVPLSVCCAHVWHSTCLARSHGVSFFFVTRRKPVPYI